MSDPVNPRRRYSSTRRAAQAADTRETVLAAARALFIADGWQKTTMAGIARQAGVSAETIYATFGTKRALLETLVRSALRGSRPDTPLLEQAGPRHVAAEPDQRRQLELFAHEIAEVLARVAPIVRVVRAASESETDLVPLYRSIHAGRRENLAFAVDAFLGRGPLRLDRDTAIDLIWRIASPELYLLIDGFEGTTGYAKWLADILCATLLKEQDAQAPPPR